MRAAPPPSSAHAAVPRHYVLHAAETCLEIVLTKAVCLVLMYKRPGLEHGLCTLLRRSKIAQWAAAPNSHTPAT